jgi:hypothetical protein
VNYLKHHLSNDVVSFEEAMRSGTKLWMYLQGKHIDSIALTIQDFVPFFSQPPCYKTESIAGVRSGRPLFPTKPNLTLPWSDILEGWVVTSSKIRQECILPP